MWNKQQDCRAEKELRYSIRKYKFGAASVAIAALMFLGARVASADSLVDKTSQPNAGVVNPENKAESPVGVTSSTENKVDEVNKFSENQALTNNANSAPTVDKAKLRKVVEELSSLLSTKLNLDESVVSPVKDRLQKGKEALESSELVQKDIDELAELLSKDVTVVSAAAKEATEVQVDKKVDKQVDKTEKPVENLANQSSPEVSASEESQTVSAKKDSLKVSVDQLQAAVLELPEHETSKEVLEKANELLVLAQGVIQNTKISPNDIEDLTKRVKKMFNSVKNATTRLTSGARDSRNGQRIPQGTQFRAGTQIDSGALKDIKYYASVDPSTNGGKGTRNDDPDFTENKTVIKAFYQEDSTGKWIVYDVFFNNDGRKMTDKSYGQHYYFQPPFNIMDPANIVKDLSFTRYRKNGGTRLSDGFQGFEQYGNSAEITNPWTQKQRIFNGDRRTFYDPNSGVARENQKPQVFKNNANDPILNQIVRKKDGNYTGGVTYNLGIEARQESTDYAVHMHAKVKLKNDVTENEANEYGRVFAASVTSGPTTNQSYVVGARGTSLKPKDTIPPTITANGATVTKNEKIVDIPVTAVDNTGGVGMRPNNPIEVTGLPQGLTFTNGKITGTPTGPVGNSTVTIKAYDKNGNKAEKTITITVKDQASKYNPTGDTLTVNQGQTITDDAVKAKVKNYAPGSLTVLSKPSTAKPGNVGNAVVKVTYPDGSSENVNVPVTVLEAPDTQPPTLAITPANQTVVEGQTVTFTVTARDNKIVNLDANDFLTKYGTRVFSGKASVTSPTDTDTEKIRRITITTTAEDVGKTNTITFNATDNANHRAKPVSFTFTVTSRDKIAPTITAGDATVTSREQITPISVTAVDNPGGVGLRDNNPIEVSGLPAGLTYANNQITGTPTGAPGNSTVTIKAHDKNGNTATKTITITVKSQADAHNPTGAGLTVNQNHTITDAELKAKVSNFAPGTLSIVSKPSTTRAGNVGNAVVKVTYPDGTFDNVNVPVTVTDVTGPTITAESATVTKNESITPIPVTAVDNTGGVGMRDNNPIEVTNLPAGLRYANNQITGTPTAGVGYYTVTIKAYDKNNRSTTKQIRITVQDQASKYNPTGETLTVPYNHNITDDEVKAKVQNFAPGTLTVQSKPSTNTSGNVGNAVVKVTYPDGSHDTVNVPVVVGRPNKDDYTPKYNDGSGKPGTSVEIPVGEANGKTIPSGTTYTSGTPGIITVDKTTGKVTVTIPSDKNPGDKVTGKVLVRYPDGSEEEVPVTVTVVNRDKDDYTPKYNDGSGKPGSSVEIPVGEANGKTIPSGTTYTSGTPGIITVDKTTGKVTVTIPSDKNPGDKVTGKVLVRYPDGSTEEVPVTVTVVNRDKDDYTPKYNDGSGKPGSSVEIPVGEANGKTIPSGTTYTSGTPGIITVDKTTGKVTVTIPSDKNPGDKVTGKVLVRYPDGSTEEVPVTVTVVNRDKDDYTPKYNDGSGKPGSSVEIPVGEANGKTIPSGTTYTSGTPGIITVDKTTGKVTVTIPSDKNPGDKVTGKVLVRYPDGSEEEVPVTVTVTPPEKLTPTVDVEQDPKTGDVTVTPKKPDGSTYPPGTKVEIPGKDGNPITVTIGEDGKGKVPNSELPDGKVPGTGKIIEPGKPAVEVPVETPAKVTPETPVTEKPGKIEITQQPNGNVIVTPKKPDGSTYPPGTKVEIPGEDGNTITVTIGDNGSGEVPNDNLPKTDIPGTGTVTEPNKKPSQPVDVTTPARKTPTVDVEQDPKTGDVTVTPKKPDGSTYPPGTKVEIPGKDGNPIIVTIGEDGKGKVPNSELPDGKVPGTGKITEPGKPAVEVPVETPAKVTPETPVTEKPGKIEITQQPNGNVIVTPKKPDGSTYPPGTKVEIPGEDGNTITVTIGDNGSGEVPNDNLPKTDIPGTGTVTEPNKKPSQPVDVTTPARKTPTVDVEQDPKTGDVTVTPKKPDGSTYPPGTKVEIPGKDGNPIIVTIGEDGKGKVPNSELPDGKVPGTGKITEPGKPAVEVPVETPAKVTPETPVTEKPGKIEITQQPNGNAIVTPKKPDGSTYPPGTKVEIPGEDGNTITVTIGDNGSGEVPNDNLPKTDIPGTGTVTEPNKKPSQPVDVTTPARKTPTVDVEQDPKTGDVTVTPKKPDGSTYPPGTKVEIPGKDGNPIIVTIGEDGKGKVPNSELPDGKVPGTGKITEPGKPAVEVPVETPAKVTPETPVTEKPGKIEITQQPNGNAIVTPKKPDGSTYPPGTKVEIPGEDGNTITVTIGDNGSGEVPNDNLPKTDIPGTGTVTEPNKKPSQPVDVTTPARKTPTVDVEQDPKIGDVTVTPKKPDGSTYPPGTKVEIPGKDDNPITVTIGEDGKGKVPNSELPDGKVPGIGKIIEPGKPAVEVPVETPAKVTLTTPIPNADQVDTKTANDNGAKSNDSQNVLPNTGTESNATLASLGLLGMLGGLGLALGKKKED